MGIDTQTLHFLKYASGIKKFGNVATLGRQELQVHEFKIRRDIKTKRRYNKEKFCESLLINEFGANNVDSFDNSDYENASYIVDLNLPINCAFKNSYDTVLNIGVLEHIYHITQALKNCSDMLKLGGQIIHILPANNLCGHGFWQFSPELFFSLNSEENGFENLEVFIADINNNDYWYKVKKPINGARSEIRGKSPQYLMVRAVKTKLMNIETLIQSDYKEIWTKNNKSKEKIENKIIKFEPILKHEYKYIIWYYIYLIYRPIKLIINSTLNNNTKSPTNSLYKIKKNKLLKL